MRIPALLMLLAAPAAFAQVATTNCYTIGDTFLSCETRGAVQPVTPQVVTPELVQLLVERLVHVETLALADARNRVMEKLVKLTEKEWDAWNTQRIEAETLKEATQWLGRAPSPLALARWTAKPHSMGLSRLSPEERRAIFAKPK